MGSFWKDNDTLRTIILRELTRLQQSDGSDINYVFVRCLANTHTRNVVYHLCLEISEEDNQQRFNVATLILTYIVGFPPSKATLFFIRERCGTFVKESAMSDRQVYVKLYDCATHSLEQVCLSRIHHGALAATQKVYAHDTSTIAAKGRTKNKNDVTKGKKSVPLLLETTKHHSFTCDATNTRGNEVVWQRDDKIITSKAQLKELSSLVLSRNTATMRRVQFEYVEYADYIDMMATERNIAEVIDHTNALLRFCEKYSSDTRVVRATLFFISRMCEDYVLKTPIGVPSSFFRSTTVTYLPLFLECMESEYLCVRNHVYTFLLTLHAHVQRIDTTGIYHGCTAALEREVWWLTLNVLHRQCILKVGDETTWEMAAKCTLALLPSQYLHHVDPRALLHFLRTPNLAELYPKAFTAYVRAFVRSLMLNNHRTLSEDNMFSLDENAFEKCGGLSAVLFDVCALYRRSITVRARQSLFHLLFACAVRRVKMNKRRSLADERLVSTENRDDTFMHHVRSAFAILQEVDFAWHFHPLLFYSSRESEEYTFMRVRRRASELESRGCHHVLMQIVQELIIQLHQEAEIPATILHNFTNVWLTEPGIISAQMSVTHNDISGIIEQTIRAVPFLLKERNSARSHAAAWRSLFHCVCISETMCDPSVGKRMLHQIARYITAPPSMDDDVDKVHVRQLCPDLLATLAAASSYQPAISARSFSIILEYFLFSVYPRLDAGKVAALSYRLFEYMLTSTATQYHVSNTANLLTIVDDAMNKTICTAAAQSIGSRVLWIIYRYLRREQAGTPCRIRYIVIKLLTYISSGQSLVDRHAWQTVVDDMYPPVALLALSNIQACDKD